MSQPVLQGNLTRLTSTNLADRVRTILLSQLTSGSLRPGDRVNEAELARTLGISRNPIREAISGLVQRGFIVAEPRRGSFLRRFDERDINDVFSFRTCIETFAVRQALPLMTENDHAELVAIVDAMIAAADDDDVSSVQDKDLLLHRRICEMSCNNQTIRAHEGINTEVQMLIASVKLDQESLAETAHAHIGIVRAIATKQVDVTVGAIEKHIETTWSYVLSAYRAAALAAQDQEYHEPSRGSHGTPLKASVIGGR